MAYSVIRTDLMSGTKQPADLVSLIVEDSGTPIAVENGVIVKIGAYLDNERELLHATIAAYTDDMSELAVVASPELMYDERKEALEDFINEAGRPARGYRLRSRNGFSLTKEGFVSATPPAVGDKLKIGTGGKLTTDANGTFGTCKHIETVGGYTWYYVEIGKVE